MIGFIGVLLILAGIASIGSYYLLRKVPKNFALVKGDNVFFEDKWIYGFFNEDNLIEAKKKVIYLPENQQQYVGVQTLDDGILHLHASISYAPDTLDADHLRTYKNSIDVVEQSLRSRFRNAIDTWAKQKSVGTLRRAKTMKSESQQFCRAYLTQSSTESDDTSLALYSQDARHQGMPIKDLGIVVYEVNVFDMYEYQKGTGEAVWGDENTMTRVEKLLKKARTDAEGMNLLESEIEEIKKGASPELQKMLDAVIKQQKRDLKRYKE